MKIKRFTVQMSHNTMGAFFSGTDNADDRANICFSGVVGKITATTYETVWRFNFQAVKHEVKFEDIFDTVQATEDNVPQEWLDKVKTQTYQYAASGVSRTGVQGGFNNHGGNYGGTGNYGGKGKGKGRADHLKEFQFKSGQGKGQNGANGNRLGPQFNESHFNAPGVIQGSVVDMDEQDIYNEAYGFPRSYPISGTAQRDALEFSGVNVDADDTSTAAFRRAAQAELEAEQAAGGNGLGKSLGTLGALDHAESDEDPIGNAMNVLEAILAENVDLESPLFDELCVSHGVSNAVLFTILQNGMANFAGDDALLKTLIADQFQLLSPETQAQMVREVFELLAPSQRERIEQNGL